MFRIRHGLCAIVILTFSVLVGAQDPKQEGRKFDLKLEKDKKFYQQSVTSVQQVIKVMGQDLTQSQESTFFFKWTPIKQEGDKWELTDEIEGVKMSIDISGNVIKYDSTTADGGATAGNPGLMDFFKKLIGAKFTVTFDQKLSKVDKVDGTQAFLDSFGSAGSSDNVLKKILTPDAVKLMCDPSFGIAPDSPKKPGESWEKKSTMDLGPIGSYAVTYKYTYVGPEKDKDLDKIEVETTLTYIAPKDNPQAPGMMFRIKDGKLSTDGAPAKGTILYNYKLQRIESGEIKIKLKGELTVTIAMTDTKVELQQEQTTKFTTSDSSLMNVKK